MKLIFLFLIFFFINTSYAQSTNFFKDNQIVNIDYKDAPVRNVLEQMLKQSAIKNYFISNDVNGLITLKLENQKFENALKIVMRANNVPLLYKIENDILIIDIRKEIVSIEKTKIDINIKEEPNSIWQKINLTFIDPLDFQAILGRILNNRQFSRYGN